LVKFKASYDIFLETNNVLTLYQTLTGFYGLLQTALEIIAGKGGIAQAKQFLILLQ